MEILCYISTLGLIISHKFGGWLDKNTYFLVLHGKQLRGTRLRRLTTRNCSSGECPDEDVVAEGGVGVMLEYSVRF